MIEPPLNVVVLMKEGERYVFVYDRESESASILLQTLGRFAADPELSFTWSDAAKLSRRVLRLHREAASG